MSYRHPSGQAPSPRAGSTALRAEKTGAWSGSAAWCQPGPSEIKWVLA